jgi:hypothetical protein
MEKALMIIYPYVTPQIMTDDLFVQYGGYTGVSQDWQREIAYNIAEMQVATYLNSFIVPTTATGTFSFYDPGKINLEYGYYLTEVSEVKINCWSYGKITQEDGYARIVNDVYGDITLYDSYGNKAGLKGETATLVYTSGLPESLTNLPIVRAVLTRLSQLELNEIVDPTANEGGAGDPGVQGFSAISYSEQRVALKHTAFGTSAVANRILLLLRNIKGSFPAMRAR